MKKPRKVIKGKPIDIDIDTPLVDIDFSREDDGSVELIIDTALIDAVYTKDADGKVEWSIIKDHKMYDFESNGSAPELPKGKILRITGEFVKIFLKANYGKLLKKDKK